MPDDRGKALLYDDLVESLTAAEDEVEKLRALVQRMAARLADRQGITAERALSSVLVDMTGLDLPKEPPPVGDLANADRLRRRAGAGRW